jgi:hypothetical protein
MSYVDRYKCCHSKCDIKTDDPSEGKVSTGVEIKTFCTEGLTSSPPGTLED